MNKKTQYLKMLIRMCKMWDNIGYMQYDKEIHDWWMQYKLDNPNYKSRYFDSTMEK